MHGMRFWLALDKADCEYSVACSAEHDYGIKMMLARLGMQLISDFGGGCRFVARHHVGPWSVDNQSHATNLLLSHDNTMMTSDGVMQPQDLYYTAARVFSICIVTTILF